MLFLGRCPSGSVVNCPVCSAVSVSLAHLSWLTGLSQDQAEATLQLSPVLSQSSPAFHSSSELEIVASWLLALALLGNPTSGTSRVSGPLPGVLMGLRCGKETVEKGCSCGRNGPIGGEERRDKLDRGAGESQAP